MKKEQENMHMGHAYVDMGLRVKWATCNVGAFNPGDHGNYYAWGETETKQSYTDNNCATWKKEVDDIGGTSRDVAHAEWGGGWRMPTRAELEELSDEDNCTWEWTTQDGHKGYKVRSKKTGNWIFLPAAGCRHGMPLYAGEWGEYWSSQPYENYTQEDALILRFNSGHRGTIWSRWRWRGQPVRPVGEF